MTATLHFGDNLEWLKRQTSGKVDLCYIDPPFNSKADYNIQVGDAQVKAFGDTWSWGAEDMKVLVGLFSNNNDRVARWAKALEISPGHCGMSSYLLFMAERLVEIKRVLKPTGSIYIHCDQAADYHLRMLMDAVFGPENFQRQIIWRIGWVSGYKTQAHNWIRNHDALLYYTANKDTFTFNKTYLPYPKDYVRRDGKPPVGKGFPLEDTWNCHIGDVLNSINIMSFSKEKVGYPTQKPLALLERIILASSNPGDLVMDCFLGSGTTAVAAVKNGRDFIGCDLSYHAINIATDRLKALPGQLVKEREQSKLRRQGRA